MELEKLIKKIIESKYPQDVFTMSSWKVEYEAWRKKIHPDICPLVGSGEAMGILNAYKNRLETPKLVDDSGELTYTDSQIIYYGGDIDLLKKSLYNYQELMKLSDDASEHFKKYLPTGGKIINDKLFFDLPKRAVPLINLKLEEKYVRFIFNRLTELSAWLGQVGYVHGGLNPETVFVVPEDHGIIVSGFYHVTQMWERMKTISGKYDMWYPPSLVTNKKAYPDIDIMLSKKIAMYLLGDRSGSGVILKKTIDPTFANILMRYDATAVTAYRTYRGYLEGIEKKFYLLNI